MKLKFVNTPRSSLLALVLILVAAFILRLPLLDGSFWLDEAAQALESARPLSQQLDIKDDFQPPLLHLITHFAMLISRQEWWLRTWGALVPGVITILGVYLLGKKIGGTTSGITAALLLSTSSFHIFYSQELRPYSLSAMFAVWSWYFLHKILEAPHSKTENSLSDQKSWQLFTLCSIGGIYSTYLYPFVTLGQLSLTLFKAKKSLPAMLNSLLMTLVAFIPGVLILATQLKAGLNLSSSLPGWGEVVGFSQLKSLALILGKFIFGVLNLELNIWYAIPSILILVALIFLTLRLGLTSYWKDLQTTHNQLFNILFFWLALPLTTVWLASWILPILQPKRVLFLLPGLYLVVGYMFHTFLDQYLKQRSRSSRIYLIIASTLVGVMLAVNLASTFKYYLDPTLQRENWRALREQIVLRFPRSQTALVFAFPAPFAPWEWYDGGEFGTISTGVLQTTEASLSHLKLVNDYSYILLPDYLRDLTDPERKVPAKLKEYGFVEVDYIDQTGIGFVRIWQRTTTVIGSKL